MRTLGLDPSFTGFGWAIIDDEKLVTCGTIKTTPKTGEFLDRIKFIKKEVTEIIELYKPEYVAVEDVYVNMGKIRNMKTTIMLAKLHGAVIDILVDFFSTRNIRVYNNATIKKAICGHGAATKKQVIDMATLQIGYKGKSDDEADAAAAALGCEREVKYERRISKNVDKMLFEQ
jgi:crossover junction endodeoxyribonuclease RuvC